MKKKFMLIALIVVIVAMAAAGTAFAYGGAAGGTGERFASVKDYATVEEFHAAVLAQKLVTIDERLAEGSITQEQADEIKAYLATCDGTCELNGEKPNRPQEGWGIFGRGTSDGSGYKNSGSGNGGKGIMSGDCTVDIEPLMDGTGSENAMGNRHGRNN